MQIERIPYADTGLFSRTVIDYLSQREDFKDFYGRFPELEAFDAQAAERKAGRIDRKVLHTVLKEQHDKQQSTLQTENLEALLLESTFSVSTGHQLCLFTGPLYFLYKIISTINLAKQLTESTSQRVVPIFWMATEDHDIDEVDHLSVFGKQIKWESPHQGAVGRMKLDGIKAVIDQVKSIIGEGEHAERLMTIFSKAYDPGMNLSQATRSLVQALFAESGLLIIDADDSRLKTLFKEKMRIEIEQGLVQSASAQARKKFEFRGDKVQANPRAINLFYMTDGARHRIDREGDDFRIVGTDMLFERADLLAELEKHPERFSPNVLFRPLFQETILPNLATIGGGGELAYWLELKDVFKEFEVPFPILLLRNSVLFIDSRTMSRWEESGFELMDFFRDPDILEKEYSQRMGGEDVTILEEKKRLLDSFERILEKSAKVDPSMAQFTRSEKARLLKSVETIEKKLIRAEKKKQETGIGRIRGAREKVFPSGGLQERKENFIPHYLKQGESFIEFLLDNLDPLDMRFTIVKSQ